MAASKARSAVKAKILRPVKKKKVQDSRKQRPTTVSVAQRNKAIDTVEATSSVVKDVAYLVQGQFNCPAWVEY